MNKKKKTRSELLLQELREREKELRCIYEIDEILSQQNLSIEEREELLNTKIRQVELATERNGQTKNMLTVFTIINVVVLITFISLIVMKVTGSR